MTAGAGVCFDTSALIVLVDAGVLDEVGKWFPEGAYRAAAVDDELRSSLDKHPQNQEVLDCHWLEMRAVEIEDEEYRKLHLLYGARRGKGGGEAETLALSRAHGWTAVINDKPPRNGASLLPDRVTAVCTCELFVVAAAHEFVSPDEGWELHQTVHRRYAPKTLNGLGIERHFEGVFRGLIDHVKKTMPAAGFAPALGSVGRLDEIVRSMCGAVGVC